MKKSGFTLAEVLITLAIIGVVAALTIPTLLTNVTDRQFRAGHNTFQRKFGEALKVMNTQSKLKGYTTTEAFVKELSKNIKILKTCDNNNLKECFPEKFPFGEDEIETKDIKEAKDLGKKDWNTNVMGIQFVNGVSALLAYNPGCKGDPYDYKLISISGNASSRNDAKVTIGVSDCVALVYDVNTNAKPNKETKQFKRETRNSSRIS